MSKNALLVAAVLFCGTGFANAQSGQVYWGGGAYPPTMPRPQNPYGYPPQFVQPAQYPMSGYAQNPYGYPAAVPMIPSNGRAFPIYSNAAQNSYGVNYYQMPNPMNYSPTPAPYSAVANSRAIGKPMGWPVPAVTRDMEVDMQDEPSGYTDIRRPAPPVPYHRETNERCFGSLEYYGIFLRPMRFSGPLVTTGAANDPAQGALGQPGTRVLFGQDAIDYGLASGLRAQVGMFLDDANHYSIDLGGFYVFQNTENFNITSDGAGNPPISRPIFNIATGLEGAFINSRPGTVAASLNIDMKSEIGGFELNARRHWYTNERLHADALVGFRYMRLAESLRITEALRPLDANFVTFGQVPIGLGGVLVDDDFFQTSNQFFGPQIGGRLAWEQKWFTASAFAKLGLGVTTQSTSISGSTVANSANGTVVAANGGILALPTNIGNHNRTVFGILPEFGVNLGIELTQCVRLNLGYSLLLWNHVVRPGSQFDRAINPALAPSTPPPVPVGGPQGPIYRFNDEFFWANAFNIGFEFHY